LDKTGFNKRGKGIIKELIGDKGYRGVKGLKIAQTREEKRKRQVVERLFAKVRYLELSGSCIFLEERSFSNFSFIEANLSFLAFSWRPPLTILTYLTALGKLLPMSFPNFSPSV